MSQKNNTENPKDLIGEPVSAVSFVQDYIEIIFDGPLFRFYDLPKIKIKNKTWAPSDEGWRDALCVVINKKLIFFKISDEKVFCKFDDEVEIEAHFDAEKYLEHFHFCYPGHIGIMKVW